MVIPRRTPRSVTATRWDWPSSMASSIRSGRATSTRATSINNGYGHRLSAEHLVPADGHRRRAADHLTARWGRSRSPRRPAARSASPSPSTGRSIAATFVPGDVQVFYHDTTNGDPSVPLTVTGVTPVAAAGPGLATTMATPSSRSPSTPRPPERPATVQLHRHLQLSDRSGQRCRPCH